MPGPVSDSYEGPSDDTPPIPAWALEPLGTPTPVHLSSAPFTAACGADEPNQSATTIREHVTCPCCLGNHDWTGRQLGGDPTDAISTEWVEYCRMCGMEKPGSGVDLKRGKGGLP